MSSMVVQIHLPPTWFIVYICVWGWAIKAPSEPPVNALLHSKDGEQDCESDEEFPEMGDSFSIKKMPGKKRKLDPSWDKQTPRNSPSTTPQKDDFFPVDESNQSKHPLFTDLADDVNSFLAQYNSGLRALLDRHAPLSSRTFTICPDNPWSNPAIATKKRSIDRPERRWKRTGLVIDG
ncbi:hypothetical protein DAPPUDRAFT_322906 [Daphnia pulex]|uniref:Uncharacterized protein n=1 Tax=Daphnia pulex TaxID=6669 RepID=E9GX99_DAPPU|nr:hypothetical protein DAPPUDRAFT_322906 [Daphnia pulex]|eukprot:EFX75834.1 hypothetical protein DAPPUDRAFT_322906 [Daphnia pulex]